MKALLLAIQPSNHETKMKLSSVFRLSPRGRICRPLQASLFFPRSQTVKIARVADYDCVDCFDGSSGARTRRSHVSALRLHRRDDFKSDAVRVAGDFVKDFRIYSASRSKPAENFAERYRVHAWNFCVVHCAGIAADRAQKQQDAMSRGAVFNLQILILFSC